MQALIFIFFLTLSIVARAENSNLEKTISRLVESSHIKRDKLGMVVAESSGKIIYDLNGKKKYIPASLTKIVTAAAILENFPVGHQFTTDILVTQDLKSGQPYNGDIYLRGGGDPGFVSESMWYLVNEFLRNGVKEIKGNIIVDDSRFDSIRFDSSREQERVDRAFDAPVGAMTFNWSVVNIFVRPGLTANSPAIVYADPENNYIKIINKARTTAAGKKTNIEVHSLSTKTIRRKTKSGDKDADKNHSEETIEVRGSIPLGGSEFVAYKSITQPDIWAGEQLKEFLSQRGVKISGDVKSGVTPKSAKVVAQNKSKPVGQLVESMMKFSNNYIAEILTKNLGAEIKGAPGTMSKGVEIIQKYLRSKNISDFDFKNPSGLTRENSFSPRSLLQILLDVSHNLKIYPEYLSSLPIAGVDGTLKHHLGEEEFGGRVRAKTGHLSGVSGLGGFVNGPDNQDYVFVFIFNGRADESYATKSLFDKILLAILEGK